MSERENALVQGQRVTENVYLCKDGKYRWVYELKIMSNPLVFKMTIKVITIVCLICAVVFTMILGLSGNVSDVTEIIYFFLMWVGIYLLFLFAIAISIPIYSAINKGSYWVLFEMDEMGITHIQMDKTFQKSKALAWLSLLTADSIGDVGSALYMGNKNTWSIKFSKTRKIKIERRNGTIYLNGWIMMGQAMAQPEDFDFILNYIINHVPEQTRNRIRG